MGGLPHSDISGSQLDYSSPKLFAVIHVLLRLLMPRHSPFALSSLALFIQILSTKDALSNMHFLFKEAHRLDAAYIPHPLLKGCILYSTHLR